MHKLSLHHTPATKHFADTPAMPGMGRLLYSRLQMLRARMQGESYSFAAMGLAEGGDVDGATELMERSRKKQP